MSDEEYKLRAKGLRRTGTVDLRAFDRGVVETMGATVDAALQDYFVSIGGVTPPPGPDGVTPLPGVPVTFANPEDVYAKYKFPVILVRRDSIDMAMQRWHPRSLQYRTAAVGSVESSVVVGGETLTGPSAIEELEQALPYDIVYTISIQARHRGPEEGRTGMGSPRNQANSILKAMLRIWPPYSSVLVRDSIDDVRTYAAFQEGIAVLDEVSAVADRMVGFALTVRVEGELDHLDPVVHKTVTSPARVRSSIL